MEEINYYVIGGQYHQRYYGSAKTLLGAKRLATQHEEYWDNYKGWHCPCVYAASDCFTISTETGDQIVHDPDAQPVAEYNWYAKKWTTRSEDKF